MKACLLSFCILHSAFCIAPAAAQQPQQPSTRFLEGTEAFRRIIFDTGKELLPDSGFQALHGFNELNEDPQHTLLIVLGDATRLREIPGGLRNFVQDGGALFLASDKPLRGTAESVEGVSGYTVSGEPIYCPNHDVCYHGLDYCPFLQPQDGADPDLFRDLVAEGGPLSTVATNAPSRLEPNQFNWPRLPVLAWLPPPSRREGLVIPAPDEQPLPFAAGGDVGDGGRVLLLADHSIFINEMMLQKDNGNVEFSYNCLQWLVGDNNPRTRILFVEDGRINPVFEVPLKEVPDELADRILDFLTRHLPEIAQKEAPVFEHDLQAFDQHNGANRALFRWLAENDASPNGFLRVLAFAAAALVVLYGCYKVGWKARYRSDLQGPLLATALHRVAPAATVAEQRRKALIRGNNLWEPARGLARECLATAGAPAGAAPPPVRVRGGWLRRWTTAGRVRRLWRLAYGPPVHVPLSEWRRLAREVQELKAAFADGTVQFQ